MGRLAVQLALSRGAMAIAGFDTSWTSVDLVFDTVGGDRLARSAAGLRPGGTLVSMAEEPPDHGGGSDVERSYFVVEPNREQLAEIGALVDRGVVTPAIDRVFALEDAAEAFERTAARGKQGKVVLQRRRGPGRR